MPPTKKPAEEGPGQKKTRSRFGCWPCKARKVKCGEEKPICKNCERQGETCDYRVRLNWSHAGSGIPSMEFSSQSLPTTPSTIVFPSPEFISNRSNSGSQQKQSDEPRKTFKGHGRSRSNVSTPIRDTWEVDPSLRQNGSKTTSGLLTVDDNGIRNGSFAPQFANTSTIAEFGQHQSNSIESGSQLFTTDSKALPEIVLNSSVPMISPIFTSISPINNPPGPDSEGYFESPHPNKKQKLGSYGQSPTISLVKYESPEDQLSISGRLNTSSVLQPNSVTTDLPVASDQFVMGPTQLDTQQQYDLPRGSVPVSFLLDKGPSRQNSRGERDPHSIEFRISAYTSYGYDTGQPDRDVPENDDLNAIVGSPAIPQGTSFYDSEKDKTLTFALDNYYENAVQINIPKILEPLPEQLTANPMNLLYFHHFLNHVARILLPHDCPINPYRTVLPKMAVHDPDLLNLLLAYSSCHRSRLLSHPEPKMRILGYVANVFSRLAEALESPEIVTEKHLATAIMLGSLEIVSPQAFEHRIRWFTYLDLAREMFTQRKDHKIFNADMYFLCRWYGYLDIMGSMSGAYRKGPLEFEVYWVTNPDEDEDTIDCLLGCTMHCMRLLGDVAKLIKDCQRNRFDEAKCRIRPRWHPSSSQKQRAQSLIKDLEESSRRAVTTCPHETINSPIDASHSTDLRELMSANIIYHWAGIIQIHRRVLNSPQDSPDVLFAINTVLDLLGTIRPGSPAEACMLFPIFTAGCEIKGEDNIEPLRKRMADISGLGMRQMVEAKEIMEKVWKTGELWENIVKDEFIG